MAATSIGLWTWIWSTRHCGVRKEVALMLNKVNWLRLTGIITLVLLIWKWVGLFLRKNHLLRCWVWVSLLNWVGALTLSLLVKLPPKKLEPWFVLWSFFLLRLLSTICPCMDYCCHVWACAASCYLELWDKLQKRICRSAGPMEPLAHCRNVASLSLFYRYYFGSCSSELAQLVLLGFSGREVYSLFW